ncbi:MAG: YhdP family protein [Pseudomonadota bacterium]
MFARIRKWLLYTVGALIVLLALAVGLLRLAMPQLPEYRDEIIARIAAAIDGDVHFERLDARWRLRGPEIVFYDVRVGPKVGAFEVLPIELESVTVGISLSRLLLSQSLEVRRIGLEGGTLTVDRSPQGWIVQGAVPASPTDAQAMTVDVAAARAALPFGDNVDVRIAKLQVTYLDSAEERAPWVIALERGTLDVTAREMRLEAAVSTQTGARADVFVQGDFARWTLDALIGGEWRATAELDNFSAEVARAVLPASWRMPRAGNANLTAAVQWRDGALDAATIDLDADSLVPPDGGDQSRVAGHAEWSRTQDGWICAVSDFVVGVSDRQWPAVSANIAQRDVGDEQRVEFDLANVTVYDLPYLASFLPVDAAAALLASQLSGTLTSADGFAQYSGSPDQINRERLSDFGLNLEFVDMAVAPIGAWPGVSGATGTLRMAQDTASLTLNSTDAAVSLPAVFAAPVPLDLLAGTLIWRTTPDGLQLISDAVQLRSASLALTGKLDLLLGGQQGKSAIVNAAADWSMGDINDADGLLPVNVMRPKLVDWLRNALIEGRIASGTAVLRGDLANFPFEDGDGEFAVRAKAENVTMQYARQWPTLTDVSAEVEMIGKRLATTRNQGLSGGVPFKNANVRFDDLLSAKLLIDTKGRSGLKRLYEYAGDSPLRNLFGKQFDNMSLSGNAQYQVSLVVPLKALTTYSVDASLTTDNATFALDYLPFGLTDLGGTVRIDRQGVYAQDMTATLLDAPVTLRVSPVPDDDRYSLMFSAAGMLTSDALTQKLGLPLTGRVAGSAPFDAIIRLPQGNKERAADAALPVEISLTSALEGLGIDLPYPVGKSQDAALPASLLLSIGPSFDVRGSLGEWIDLVALIQPDPGTAALQVERATVHLGDGRALLPLAAGLYVDGSIDQLRLGDWLNLKLTDGNGWVTDNLTATQVSVDDLYIFGQRVRGVDGTLQRAGENWLIDVQSEAVAGTVSVPRDLSQGDAVVLDMRRLALLEADPIDSEPADPTSLPPLRIRAEQFALGERQFGALELDLDKTPDGLVATRLATANEAFAVSGSGDWLLDSDEPEGSRTRLQAEIRSTDVKRMMRELGYAPGIDAPDLTSTVDLSWAGGPDDDFLDSLDGEVSLRIVDGTLDEVDPGAGRVVGLISLAELPRRLALDFRDVFQRGFNFDEIKGDFRLVNGDAYTCNLSLEGASADVGIIGRASLDLRNYNQTAVVSVKVGNTLPAVGAVVAGPQVGAVLLLFSQIFKKPLQGMTQIYYQINGSWDEPSIDRTDSARFVATAELAGCLLQDNG